MITIEKKDDIQIVKVESAIIDSKIANSLRQTITDMVPLNRKFIIDLANTNLIDSGGLAGMVMLQKFMNSQQCQLSLCSMTKTVKSVFQMTRLDRLFKLGESVNDSITQVAVDA